MFLLAFLFVLGKNLALAVKSASVPGASLFTMVLPALGFARQACPVVSLFRSPLVTGPARLAVRGSSVFVNTLPVSSFKIPGPVFGTSSPVCTVLWDSFFLCFYKLTRPLFQTLFQTTSSSPTLMILRSPPTQSSVNPFTTYCALLESITPWTTFYRPISRLVLSIRRLLLGRRKLPRQSYLN